MKVKKGLVYKLPTQEELEAQGYGIIYNQPTHCTKCKKKTKHLHGFSERSAMCIKCFAETMLILQAYALKVGR